DVRKLSISSCTRRSTLPVSAFSSGTAHLPFDAGRRMRSHNLSTKRQQTLARRQDKVAEFLIVCGPHRSLLGQAGQRDRGSACTQQTADWWSGQEARDTRRAERRERGM